MSMLEVSPAAASAIAHACEVRELPTSGGVRIFPRRTDEPRDLSIKSLVVEFVGAPVAGDTVLRENGAAVFLAEGVEHVVGSRLLDIENSGGDPRLVLRRGSSNEQRA
jgi:hypothetical protein